MNIKDKLLHAAWTYQPVKALGLTMLNPARFAFRRVGGVWSVRAWRIRISYYRARISFCLARES